MKKALVGIIMSVMFFTFGFGQIGIESREQAEQLLRRGKTQQVVGIVVSSAGFACIIIGLNSFKVPDLSTLRDNLNATGLAAVGIAASIVGIVNLTSGNKKIRKANLFLNSEHVGINPGFKSREHLVSVGVRLNF